MIRHTTSLIGKTAIEQLEYLFLCAHIYRASDIHIDIKKHHGHLVLRVSNRLVLSTRVAIASVRQIIGRLKLISGMRTDISDRGQDGAGTLEIPSTISLGDIIEVNFRSATTSTVYGENIVCRIFAMEQHATIHIENLGLPDGDLSLLKENLDKDSGLILVSGPTGSGKTTTLYACLNHIAQSGKMVISIEDPVEIVLPYIRQIKINKDIGYDFKDALKGVLRQDPDVIMVGEIRDSATAELAVQAALTGHLVLATIHAPSALEIIDRLKTLDISPQTCISVIQLLISQKSITLGTGKKIFFELIPLDNKLRKLFGYGQAKHIADFVKDEGILLLKDQLQAFYKEDRITQEEFNRYIRS